MNADRQPLVEVFLQWIQPHQLGLFPDDVLVVTDGGTSLGLARRQLMDLARGLVDERQ